MLLRSFYILCVVLAALSAVWYGGPYIVGPGSSLTGFVRLAFANGPAAALTSDLLVVYVLMSTWIVIEGRRLGMRHLWVYLVANTMVAVAVGLGLFLVQRERQLRAVG